MIDRLLRKTFNAESPPPMIWEPEVHGKLYPDRPYFLTRVRQGMSKLPLELQAAFKEANYSVNLGRNSKSICKSKSIEHGWMESFFEGLFDENHKAVIMPQTNFFGTLLNPIVKFFSKNELSTQNATTHELGHAFSYFRGDEFLFASESKSYVDIVISEMESLKADEVDLILKLNPSANIASKKNNGHVVREEFFAEIFSEILLGKNIISLYLPRTRAYIKKELDAACDEFRAANPDFAPDTYPKMEVAQA